MTEPAISFKKGQKALKARHAAERRFQWTGRIAIALSLAFLVFMIGSIAWQGKSALITTEIAITVDLSADNVDPEALNDARWESIVKSGLRDMFPEAEKRKESSERGHLDAVAVDL